LSRGHQEIKKKFQKNCRPSKNIFKKVNRPTIQKSSNLKNEKKVEKSKNSKSEKSQSSNLKKEHFEIIDQKMKKSHISPAVKKIKWHPGKDFRSGGF
jgi:ribosomal protein L2